MTNEIVTKQEIDTAFEAFSSLVNQARVRVAAKINSKMVMLYWPIRKTISPTRDAPRQTTRCSAAHWWPSMLLIQECVPKG